MEIHTYKDRKHSDEVQAKIENDENMKSICGQFGDLMTVDSEEIMEDFSCVKVQRFYTSNNINMQNQRDKEIKGKNKILTIVHFEIPADDVGRARSFFNLVWLENRKD